MSKEAMKLALEILNAAYVPADLDEQREKAITAIKQALAAPVQDIGVEQDERVFARIEARKNRDAAHKETAQRQWVGLTDELLRKMHHEDEFGLFCDYDEFEQIARAIEAKLKEKNT